jgi:hypothetical protein
VTQPCWPNCDTSPVFSSPAWECVCQTVNDSPIYAGDRCEGELKDLRLDESHTGELAPGRWAYFKLLLPGDQTVTATLQLSLTKQGGSLILVSKKGAIPNLLEAVIPSPAGVILSPVGVILSLLGVSPSSAGTQ